MKPLLRLTLAVAAVPALALGLLVITHELRFWPGLLALGVIFLASLALAWGWRANRPCPFPG